MYRIHKWFAVIVGGFVLVWLISGIVMILPRLGPAPAQSQLSIDFGEIAISPAQAVTALAEALGKPLEVNRLSLRRIQNVIVYEVSIRNGPSRLINAISGQVFTVTPDLAEQLVRETFPTQARVFQIEQVTRHSYSYQWGPLPAYRIVFNDDGANLYHVSINDGTIQRSDRLTRLRWAIQSLHTFEPVKLIIQRDEFRKGLLVLLGMVGIGAVVTGYCLVLTRSR